MLYAFAAILIPLFRKRASKFFVLLNYTLACIPLLYNLVEIAKLLNPIMQ